MTITEPVATPAPIDPWQLQPWARAWALKRLANRSPETKRIGMVASLRRGSATTHDDATPAHSSQGR